MPLSTLEKLRQGQSVSMAHFQIAADVAGIDHRAIGSSYRLSHNGHRAFISQHAETVSIKSVPDLKNVIESALA